MSLQRNTVDWTDGNGQVWVRRVPDCASGGGEGMIGFNMLQDAAKAEREGNRPLADFWRKRAAHWFRWEASNG